MDKQAFLSALRSGLNFLPQSEREEVIAEFEEHFEVGIERGHTEQELVDQLGDPSRIIETYRLEAISQGGLHSAPPEPPPSKPEAQESVPEIPTTRHTSIHASYPCAEVKRIQIKLVDSDLEFCSADADVRVDIEGSGGSPISVQMRDGELTITQEWRFFRLLNWAKSPLVRISLPAAFKGALDVEGTSTDIRLAAFKGSALRLHTISGDFRLGELYVAGDAGISTISGDIKGGKLMADALELRTTSGDVRLDLLTVESLSFQTVSGDLEARMTDGWKSMRFKSVSGDVKLWLPESGKRFNVELDSVSGKLKNEIGSGYDAERTIHAKSVSGDMRIKRG